MSSYSVDVAIIITIDLTAELSCDEIQQLHVHA